jgi:hypothetical protein
MNYKTKQMIVLTILNAIALTPFVILLLAVIGGK